MDKTAAIECVRQYAELVRKHFDVDKVILYGSYSRDTARKDSDIDVAVVLNHVDEDFWSLKPNFFV
jgi:uncharacterized protein